MHKNTLQHFQGGGGDKCLPLPMAPMYLTTLKSGMFMTITRRISCGETALSAALWRMQTSFTATTTRTRCFSAWHVY